MKKTFMMKHIILIASLFCVATALSQTHIDSLEARLLRLPGKSDCSYWLNWSRSIGEVPQKKVSNLVMKPCIY